MKELTELKIDGRTFTTPPNCVRCVFSIKKSQRKIILQDKDGIPLSIDTYKIETK